MFACLRIHGCKKFHRIPLGCGVGGFGDGTVKTVGNRKYYLLEEAAYVLDESQEQVRLRINNRQLPGVTIDGQLVVPAVPLNDLYHERRSAAKERRPVASQQTTTSAATRRTPPDQRSKVASPPERAGGAGKNEWITSAHQAGKLVGMSARDVHELGRNGKVRTKEIEGWIHYYRPDLETFASARKSSNNASKSHKGARQAARGTSATTTTEHAENLQKQNEILRTALAREREGRSKDKIAAQHDFDQLDAQLENLRSTKDRTIENLGADAEALELKIQGLEAELEQERERREEAEDTVRSLRRSHEEEQGAAAWSEWRTGPDSEQPASDPHNPVRDFFENFGKNVRDVLGSDEPDQQDLTRLREQLRVEREDRERDKSIALYEYAQLENAYRDLGGRNQALTDEINDMKSSTVGVPTREELQAKPRWNEAHRESLEERLVSQKQRLRQLEADSQKLTEIRHLLGEDTSRPAEGTKAASAVTDSENAPDTLAPGVLRVQTRHGVWIFRPPFVLETEEVELLRLVAGEDEITAEQIKRRTGRRRSVDDLDDLLDRLHAEDLEPIQESSGRYTFNPEILQD